jgi:hypothetical protein
MPGTGPRQRAAIAISFGVQAVLIAGALALPAELSTTAGASVAAPAPVTLLPAVSPLTSGAPFQPIGARTYTFMLHLGSLGPQSGEDIAMTAARPGAPAWPAA